jgi:acetate kinase
MLIFEPEAPYVKWYRIIKGKVCEGKCVFEKERMDAVARDIGDIDDVREIGYILYHGGDTIKSPVSRLTEKNIADVNRCVKYNPELNDITFKTAKYWMKRIPEAMHLLLCDTSFFLKLPPESSTYAIPFELKRKGVKRYGGYGLLHQWVYAKTKPAKGSGKHGLISVYLGNNTNIAAVKNDRPIDTSMGFTHIEGIMSSGGCGDIDPTIIFNLNSDGLTFNEINILLSQESGFRAFPGRNADFSDVIKNKEKGPAANVKEVFSYSIVKYIGAFFAELGGADSIVFSSDDIKAAGGFIREITDMLRFLGVKCNWKEAGRKDFFKISEPDSKIKIYCFNYKKWNILDQNLFKSEEIR